MASRKTPGFRSHNLLHKVDSQSTTRDYEGGEAIYAQGDKADAMFYVQHGHVKLTVQSRSGKKAVVAILQPGDFFGEGCMQCQSVRRSSAESIEVSTVSQVKRVVLARVLQEDPVFARMLILHLLTQIGKIEEEFVDQIFSSSEKRLARILLHLADAESTSKATSQNLKMNQETLAEMVGTTRSRVSFFMNRFRKQGFIDYNGSLRVYKSLLAFLLE